MLQLLSQQGHWVRQLGGGCSDGRDPMVHNRRVLFTSMFIFISVLA